MRPRSPCIEPRCPGLAVPGQARCEPHHKARQRVYDDARRRERPFYWSTPWRKFRAAFLAAHPVCVQPGCGAPATEVDHILARRERPDFAFEETNCRPMCKPHHSRRTAREQSWHR